MARYVKSRPLPGELYPKWDGMVDTSDRYACVVCQFPTINYLTETGEWCHMICKGLKRMEVP